jgi:uncharacterized membrane protein
MNQKKNTPTPKRKDQEAKNSRPLVASVAPKVELTKEQKKEAKLKRRKQNYQEREKMHKAYASGDERHLPLKDRGAARKMTRTLVDAHRSPAEFFLPTIIVILLVSSFTAARFPIVTFMLTVATWVYIFVIMLHMFIRVRGIKQKLKQKFKAEELRGITFYAVSRMTQLRRMRLPKVGV